MLEAWINQGGVGDKGPDNGVILADDEMPHVGRVVIEKKSQTRKPNEYYAVTTAVYGWLVNTSYFQSLADAREHADATKLLIETMWDMKSRRSRRKQKEN